MRTLSHVFTLLIIVACCLLTACHKAESVDATIVDAESGKPVDGMWVVANWEVMGNLKDGSNEGQLMSMEAMTDKKGHFIFPGWGPKIAWLGDVDAKRVRLLFLKNGYRPLILSNEVKAKYGFSPATKSEWTGKIIKVNSANSDPKIRIEEFDLFNIELHPIIRNVAACPWKKIPNFLREVRKERLALVPYAKTSDAWPIASVDQDLIGNAGYLVGARGDACGSPKDFFN